MWLIKETVVSKADIIYENKRVALFCLEKTGPLSGDRISEIVQKGKIMFSNRTDTSEKLWVLVLLSHPFQARGIYLPHLPPGH